MSEPVIEVARTSPPHRRRSVAELHVHSDGFIDTPAEIYRERGRLRIALFSKTDGLAWDYPLGQFLSAIGRGVDMLDDYYAALRTRGVLDEDE